MDRAEFDEAIRKAFQLAYFIHGDKTVAARIAFQAMSKLEVAAQAQDKRLYYEPHGRADSRKVRSKVTLNEKHLLQRLVYIESEEYELQKESRGAVSEEDMITHYIKQIIQITLKRNSFYVTLGISRLLHNYSTTETMDVYNLVIQDPERVRDDYYYRSRKGRLMQELKERFGDLLRVTKVNRGEERFEAQPLSAQYAGFVNGCLNNLIPWDSGCVIPARFNPLVETLDSLCFDSRDPDDEHRVEVNRMHTVIHPECYLKLVQSLKLDPPEKRLEIPNFALSMNQNRNDRGQPPRFDSDDIAGIKARLNEQSSRRRYASSGLLKIIIDGRERATLNLKEASSVQFRIDEGTELLTVIGSDKQGEVVLATCLLDEVSLASSTQKVVLEGGQEISFNLTPQKDTYGEIAEIQVAVSYRETRAWRAAALLYRRQTTMLAKALQFGNITSGLKPAVSLALIALLAFAIWFFALRSSPTKKELANDAPKSVTPGEQKPEIPSPDKNQGKEQVATTSPAPSNPTGKSESKPPKSRLQPSETIARGPERTPDPLEPLTRSTGVMTGVSLPEVKTIALELKGDEELSRTLNDKLIKAFASSQRFALTPDREAGDALLKISVIREPNGLQNGAASFIVRLANATGYVIFPAERGSAGRKYTGSAAEVAPRILKDLLDATHRLEKNRR